MMNAPLPHTPVTALVAPCPYYTGPEPAGCADAVNKTIYYDGSRWVYLHEMGHMFDAYNMTAESRQAFSTIAMTYGQYNTLKADNEKLADAYAECSLWGSIRPVKAKPPALFSAFWPTRRGHRKMCILFNRVG